ncbi:MAG TPA: DinB family protein [Pirellulales bacterium]|nr:DinB family protein [Pirellulales bacterium]
MQTASDALAQTIANAAGMVMFYTEDLSQRDYLHRPCAKANCAAWLIGHLTLTARSMLTRMGASDLPPLPDGFEKAYARDDTAPSAAEFPYIDQLRDVFQANHARFAEYVKGLDAARLNTKLEKPHPRFDTIGTMAAFAPIHIATHAGQISTIRRSLGRPPLV